jgi:phospholipid-binding lipoprotein MlaA
MRYLVNFIRFTLPLGVLTMVGCTCMPLKKTDPLECFNRGIYGFNKGFDYMLVRPTARLYQKVLPKPIKNMVGNFFQNLQEIPVFANDILQWRWKDARESATRFALNTTWGIGGLFDIAAKNGLEHHKNDFGITLARWGFEESIYLVLPIVGPSTARDAIGAWGINYWLTVYPYIQSHHLRYTLLGLTFVDTRADFIKHEAAFAEAAVDEYRLVRDAFLQNRSFQITSLHTEAATTPVELQGPPP